MGIQLIKIILISLFFSFNLHAECVDLAITSFKSIEELSNLTFQDCTDTKANNTKKCECQKHNSKIIPFISPEIKEKTTTKNQEQIKSTIQKSIDEIIQYFTAVESNYELSPAAIQSCSLNRIQNITCGNKNKTVLSNIYQGGTKQLMDESQCQLKQKYGIACGDKKQEQSATCIDEATQLSLILKQQENLIRLKELQTKLKNENEGILNTSNNTHPAFKIITQNQDLKQKFIAQEITQENLHEFQAMLHSPAVIQQMSQEIAQSCEQKFQQIQSVLCSDTDHLSQVPQKEIVKIERSLAKQKEKNLDQVVEYQEHLNLFCSQLDQISIENQLNDLNRIEAPVNFNQTLIGYEREFTSSSNFCSSLVKPITFTGILNAKNSCTDTSKLACEMLRSLEELYQQRSKNNLASTTLNSPSIDQTDFPEFFSKQLRSFYGDNANPKQIEPLPEGRQVSVAKYHSEVEEINRGKENSNDFKPVEQTPTQPTTPVIGSTKLNTNTTVKHAVAGSSQTKYNNDEYRYESDQIINTQNQYLEHERKTNSQMMNHFQNINQKQIDMIEKMANKIITQNEQPEQESFQAPVENVNPNIYVAPATPSQTTSLAIGRNNNPANDNSSIVYIDNNTSKGNGASVQLPEESTPTTSPSVTQKTASSTTQNRSPANIGGTSNNVEVIEKDLTTHKKYDEIIVSLNSENGEQLSNLKPHELEMINKYLEEKRPFILKKIIKTKNVDRKIDATVLIGDKSFITIIANNKVTQSEQKDYLLIKKELEMMIKIKLTEDKTTSGRFLRL